MPEDNPRVITRRDLLRGAGIAAAAAGVAAVTPADMLGAPAVPVVPGVAQAGGAAAAVGSAPLEHLTAVEGDLLDAIIARLIPGDALGPGAREAGVLRYIDRALGGALASSREAYRSGLAAFDRYCRMSRGKPFTDLPPGDQDAVLTDIQTGASSTAGAGFSGSPTQFFTMVLSHTRQGMFGDPHYGGNANFAGWDLIGYPGVRTNVSVADQQAMERNELKPNHRSAYDNQMFNKAQARAESHGGIVHGD